VKATEKNTKVPFTFVPRSRRLLSIAVKLSLNLKNKRPIAARYPPA